MLGFKSSVRLLAKALMVHYMSCEFVKIDTKNGFLIWIDIDQSFNRRVFFETISSDSKLDVISKETVFQSFGPAQIIEDIKTKAGIFTIDTAFEDVERGIRIYSNDNEIMETIYNKIVLSGSFHERT